MNNRKGFTITEIIVSVGLISIVMLFLFQLLSDMQYQYKYPKFAKENQLNRATIIKNVQEDLMNKTLIDVSREDAANNTTKIVFRFADGNKNMTLSSDNILYNDERWDIKGEGVSLNRTGIEILKIPSTSNDKSLCDYIHNVDVDVDGNCNYNCDDNFESTKNETYKVCPKYKYVRIHIPIETYNADNIIDDLYFTYIGK